ncbi:hypothetical protein BH23ACT2_BH23ACT2_26810 [soil metagenome]
MTGPVPAGDEPGDAVISAVDAVIGCHRSNGVAGAQ